jgi:hypothetical protein
MNHPRAMRRRREHAAVVLLARAHPPANNAGRWGNLILRTHEKMGQPPKTLIATCLGKGTTSVVP